MSDLIAGAIAMASFVIALFFLRFWRNSRDRFFLYFSLSFGIEGVHRIVSALTWEMSANIPSRFSSRTILSPLLVSPKCSGRSVAESAHSTLSQCVSVRYRPPSS